MGTIIVPYIANANGDLDSRINPINAAVKDVELFIKQNLNVNWKINAIFSRGLFRFVIPEDGVGGRTYASDYLEIAIDKKASPPRWLIAEMLAHEIGHALRWGFNPQYSDAFVDNAILEGIAICVQEEFAKKSKAKSYFLGTMQARVKDAESNRKLARKTLEFWQSTKYNYQTFFIDGGNVGKLKKSLPRWAGYSLGFYIVKEALQQSQMSIFEAIDKDFDFFRSAV